MSNQVVKIHLTGQKKLKKNKRGKLLISLKAMRILMILLMLSTMRRTCSTTIRLKSKVKGNQIVMRMTTQAIIKGKSEELLRFQISFKKMSMERKKKRM